MAIQDFHFVPGELYLFSLDPRHHDPDRCLWGIFDKLENGNVVLEVMTDGLTPILQGRLRPSRIRIRQAGDPQRTQRFLFQLRAPERENRRIKSSADNPHRRISHPSTGDLDRNLQAMHFIRKMHRIMETTERKPRFRKIVRTAGIVVVAVLLLLAGANLWIGGSSGKRSKKRSPSRPAERAGQHRPGAFQSGRPVDAGSKASS